MEERTYIYGYDPSGRGKIDQYLISYIKSFFATGYHWDILSLNKTSITS